MVGDCDMEPPAEAMHCHEQQAVTAGEADCCAESIDAAPAAPRRLLAPPGAPTATALTADGDFRPQAALASGGPEHPPPRDPLALHDTLRL